MHRATGGGASRPMNVYQMYAANDNRAGFWIVRDSWDFAVAKVLSVGGLEEGPLPGKPPYHGNPNPKVVVRFVCWGREKIDQNEYLSCPGTYAYRRVPENLDDMVAAMGKAG